MSRYRVVKKNKILPDSKYNSILINLLTTRILKNGKKNLANSIVFKTLTLIKKKTNTNPIEIFENAIKNTTPRVSSKTHNIKGKFYQIPTEINGYTGITLSLRWIIAAATLRSGRFIDVKLANEIIEAAKGFGNAVKKCDEIQYMAEINKTFAPVEEENDRLYEKETTLLDYEKEQELLQ